MDAREEPLLGLGMPKELFAEYAGVVLPYHAVGIVTNGHEYGFVAQIVTKPVFNGKKDLTEKVLFTKEERKSIPLEVSTYNGTYSVDGKERFRREKSEREGFLISLGYPDLNGLLIERLKEEKLSDGEKDGEENPDVVIYESGAPSLMLSHARKDLVKKLSHLAKNSFKEGGEESFYQQMTSFCSLLERTVNKILSLKVEPVEAYQLFQLDPNHLSESEQKSLEGTKYTANDFGGKIFVVPASESLGEKSSDPPKPIVIKPGVKFNPTSEAVGREERIISPFKSLIKGNGTGILGYLPTDIKSYLDDFVIGQEEAKKQLSVTVYRHLIRIHDALTASDSGSKSNVLLLGDTGTGKTHITKTLSKALGLPFIEFDCSSLTEAGYVGDDIEECLIRLYKTSGQDLSLAQKGIVFLDEFDKLRKQEGGGRDVRGNVQNSLLKKIEGSRVDLKKHGANVVMDTSNVLFICGGAFASSGSLPGLDEIVERRLSNGSGKTVGFQATSRTSENRQIDYQKLYRLVTPEDIVHFGFIPELAGRLATYVALERLTIDDLKRILTEPKGSLVQQQVDEFRVNKVDLRFTDEALGVIAQKAHGLGTGARGLKKVVEQITNHFTFAIGDYIGKELLIDADKIKDAIKE